MDVIDGFILGILQGLTEFLPVSSSGHLTLFEQIFHSTFEENYIFNISVHVATLFAVCIVFRRELFNIGKVIVRLPLAIKKEYRSEIISSPYIKLLIYIVITSIPTAILGLIIKSNLIGDEKSIYQYFHDAIWPIGVSFFVTAIILFATRFVKVPEEGDYQEITLKNSLIIGFAQGLGILQGISRSGITISTGLFSGLSRDVAGRFAFLISIPAIIGAMLLEIIDLKNTAEAIQIDVMVVLVGSVSAFIVGWVSLVVLLKFIKAGKMYHFGWYCLAAGIAVFIFFR